MRLFWELILREAADGGAGGAAPAAAAPADGGGLIAAAKAAATAAPAAAASDPAKPAEGAAPAAAAAPAVAAAPDAWFPQGLDAKFKGADANATLTNLAKHIAEQPKPPEKADGYTFTPTDKVAGRIDATKDPVLPVFREVAHKHGLTPQQFDGVINDFYGQLMDKGLMRAPVDVKAEFTKLGGGAGDPATQMQKGQERIAALDVELDGLATRQMISAAQADLIKKEFATSADGVIAFEALMKLIPKAGGGPVPGGERGGSDGNEREAALSKMYPSMTKVA